MRTATRPATVGSLIATSVLLLAACQYGAGGNPSPSSAASSAPGSSPGSAPSTAAGTLAVNVAQTDAGDALSGAGGMTLYINTNDTEGTSTCTGGCATAWPPLLGDGSQIAAGDGVTGTFGTATRDDGSQQVTYNGQPLYYYGGDSAPGDSTGDGVGGVWFIASPGEDASASQPAVSAGESPSPTPYRAPPYY